MQTAPVVLADYALKTWCKECSETIGKITNITNALNSMQINECALSKRVVATVGQGDPNILGAMWGEMTAEMKLGNKSPESDSWHSAKKKIASETTPSTNLRTKTTGCPKKIKDTFSAGSFISNLLGISSKSDELSDIIRGYFGDIVISEDTESFYLGKILLPCSENNSMSIEDMVEGKTYNMNKEGTCTKISSSLYDKIHKNLKDYIDSIKSGQSKTDFKYIASPGIPVYRILWKSVFKRNRGI